MEKNTFKIISGAEAEACRPWQLPAVGSGQAGAGSAVTGHGGYLTAHRLEEIQQQAYQEGFELGRREGLEQGRAQLKEQVDQIESVMKLLSRPLQQLDDELVAEISSLALTIARHIIRREIRIDSGQVVATVQRAAAVLPVASRNIRLFLNPADTVAVREGLSPLQGDLATWQIVEDPGLARGGCRIETEHARVDASIEKQIAAIAAELLGGDREEDDGGR